MSVRKTRFVFSGQRTPTAERLLQGLLTFVNEGPMPKAFKPGIHRDAQGRIVLHAFCPPDATARPMQRARSIAEHLLNLASHDVAELEAALNARGIGSEAVSQLRDRQRPLVRPHAPPGMLVPTIRSASEWPTAVLVAALLAPVGRHDVLANRIGRCERCRRFHLLPIGRPSRFCSRECRRTITPRRG